MKESLDLVVLHFNKDTILLLNICIAFIMFGVALELKIENFKLLIRSPKPVLIGLISQFILLPIITLILISIVEPSPSIALGMMLVAACPGGNVSNFYSSVSGGNVALSVSLTAFSSSLAFIMTPLNFTFWAHRYAPTADLLRVVEINPYHLMFTVLFILVVPLSIGMTVSRKYPNLTLKIFKPIQHASILIFAAFVVFALAANFEYFVTYIYHILFIVLIHNGLALSTGYFLSKGAKLNESDTRSITIETGIQNSGIALVIIFDYFNGLGGMALIAAWWGVWHLISGSVMAWVWSSKKTLPINNL